MEDVRRFQTYRNPIEISEEESLNAGMQNLALGTIARRMSEAPILRNIEEEHDSDVGMQTVSLQGFPQGDLQSGGGFQQKITNSHRRTDKNGKLKY